MSFLLMARRITFQASMPDLRGSDSVPRARPALTCKTCHTFITSRNWLLSRAFRGYQGKAALFTDASNISLDQPCMLLMDTGAHTIQELSCKVCTSYLGWKIIRAHERTEKWKEGHWLLELALLEDGPDALPPLPAKPPSVVAHAAARWESSHKRNASEPHIPRAASEPPHPRTGSLLVPRADGSPPLVRASGLPMSVRTGSRLVSNSLPGSLATRPARPRGPRASSPAPERTQPMHDQRTTGDLSGFV